MKQQVTIMGEPLSALPSLKKTAHITHEPMSESSAFVLYAKGPPGNNYYRALFYLGVHMGKNPDTGYIVVDEEYVSYWRRIVPPKTVIGVKSHIDEIVNICVMKSVLEHKFYREMFIEGISGIVAQFRFSEYNYDFAIPSSNLLIEVDGSMYHKSPEAQARDAKKSRDALNRGWSMIRFTDVEITHDIKKCISELKNFL